MSAWLIRREFDCDEGKVARWWLGPDAAFGERPGFGEPEDAAQFKTRLIAESEYRVHFGELAHCERAQLLTDALAEVSGGLGDPPGRGMTRGGGDGTTLTKTRGPRLPLSAERST